MSYQGRNHKKKLGEAKPMVGHNLPPLIEIGLTISENLGQAAALPSLPLITPLLFDGRLHSGPDPMGEFN